MHVRTTYHPTVRRRNAERTFFQDLEEKRGTPVGRTPHATRNADRPKKPDRQIGNDELVLNGAAGNLRPPAYRTEMPDLLVYILAAMFIEASSWKSSLAAYGMCTCEILVLFLHGRHSNVFFLRFLT